MRCMYKLSNVVVNGSQKPEGFGRVVAEAMAMGKPVVAYNHGGVQEQLSAYDNDIFKIKINDFSQMANSIDTILNMPKDTINSLGQISSKFVKLNFTKHGMIEKTINLYEKLLK